MKLSQFATSAVASLILFPSVASAGPLLHRLNHQDRRVYEGVQNGSLNYREVQRLENREDAIQAQRAKDIRDGGRLTPFEAAKLNWRLDRQSRYIYNQKHD
jgi:hypothetical protein